MEDHPPQYSMDAIMQHDPLIGNEPGSGRSERGSRKPGGRGRGRGGRGGSTSKRQKRGTSSAGGDDVGDTDMLDDSDVASTADQRSESATPVGRRPASLALGREGSVDPDLLSPGRALLKERARQYDEQFNSSEAGSATSSATPRRSARDRWRSRAAGGSGDSEGESDSGPGSVASGSRRRSSTKRKRRPPVHLRDTTAEPDADTTQAAALLSATASMTASPTATAGASGAQEHEALLILLNMSRQ